jgi:MarR family transcriptional regulator, temperature-dependent positive regulator of motility
MSLNLDGELLRHTGHLLRRAKQRHVAVWLRDVCSETTSVQFAALTVLDQRPRASQRDLGRVLDLDRSTIADLVARMARRGLIERERDDDDRRRNVLQLTVAGHDELARLRPRVEAIEPTLTAGLSSREGDELRRLLYRVLEHTAAQGRLSAHRQA